MTTASIAVMPSAAAEAAEQNTTERQQAERLPERNLAQAEDTNSHHVANDIAVVRDGAQVLDYLYRRAEYAGRDSAQPALILLDLKMPKVDGLEVLRQVKSDAQLRCIPVVVLTSSREESDVVRSYDLGVNA